MCTEFFLAFLYILLLLIMSAFFLRFSFRYFRELSNFSQIKEGS